MSPRTKGDDIGVRKLRCAVYTRKSSEEGLDQAFNSLHAQREACEAFIASQKSEGWSLVKTAYDDGGVSGGTLERAGLQRLLADVEAGRLDVVVVYKVDRQTRSLADFAKIVEILDAKGASFVSVTQAFNTTTSMGRLTLNVLLSFAQFEREVTGERIRDKIAASKAKGMWMGGAPPLGYDLPIDPTTRALIVNVAEAEVVRMIFGRYVELGSVAKLCTELEADGVRSKSWTTSGGRSLGGRPFSRGALFHLLVNRVYLGDIRHKEAVHPGRHSPIVPLELFEAAAATMASNRVAGSPRRRANEVSPLKGLVFDAQGAPMSPSFSQGRNPNRRYRYYVSTALTCSKAGNDEGVLRRAPAPALEGLVLERLSRLLRPKLQGWAEVRPALKRVDVQARRLCLTVDLDPRLKAGDTLQTLQLRLDPADHLELSPNDSAARLTIGIHSILRGGRTIITAPDGRSLASGPRRDPTLIKGLRSAHALMVHLQATPNASAYRLLHASIPTSVYERRLLRLAFLAPDIQAAILEGRQPGGIYLDRLLKSDIPLLWSDQRNVLGFPAS